MLHPDLLVPEIVEIARANRRWMGWNLILAFVPAVLATLLLLRPHRRTAAWWLGTVVFVLFLPNAPYVLTDLIHLRDTMAMASGGSVIVFGVLPLYATFIALGFTSYLYCLELIVREVRSVWPDTNRALIELPVQALCAFGIVLGRVARLNSWDTVQDPRWTLETTFNTLALESAPFAFMTIFIGITVTSVALRAVYLVAWRILQHLTRRWRPVSTPAT